MRDDNTLKELITELKTWTFKDLGVSYTPGLFDTQVQKMLAHRINEFLKRRIGHLPDIDLFNLSKLLSNDFETINDTKTEKTKSGLATDARVEKECRESKKMPGKRDVR